MADIVLFSVSAMLKIRGFQRETWIHLSPLRRANPLPPECSVDTGSDWSANLYRTLDGLQPPCQRVSAADLASRPVDWPDLSREAPEHLDYQQDTFNLREHQKEAFDAVINGFKSR